MGSLQQIAPIFAVPGGDRRASSAYLFAGNADDLAAAWLSAGAEVHPPKDTEWGKREGALARRIFA